MVEQNKSRESLIVSKLDLNMINQKLASVGRRLNALEGIGQQTMRYGTKIRGVNQDALANTDLMRKGELLVDGETGNLVMLGSSGELLDSGYSAADLLGNGGSSLQSSCRAYRATSTQIIPTATWKKIKLNAVEYDLLSEFTPDTNYWTQKAPQLAETYIRSLISFGSNLYGGTGFAAGNLYKWNGTDAWAQVAPQLNAQTHIISLAVFGTKLYGGTNPGGRLFEWNGVNAWVQVAPQLGAETIIRSLCVFNAKLYGGTGSLANLYEWNGINAWVQVAPRPGVETNIYSLVVLGTDLYGGSGPNGNLFKWNGVNAWVQVAPVLGLETLINALVVLNGKIYGATSPHGCLYEWNGVNAWVQVAGQFETETDIYSLAVFNNKIYGGTYPGGKLLEWNNNNAWVEVAPQLGAETYIYSLAVFNSKLYGGTAILGNLYEWSNGYNCSFVAQAAGKYQVNAAVNFTSTNMVAARLIYVALYKNGSLVAKTIAHTGVAGEICVPLVTIVDLSAGSYLELYVYHNVGAQLTVDYNDEKTHFEVTRVA